MHIYIIIIIIIIKIIIIVIIIIIFIIFTILYIYIYIYIYKYSNNIYIIILTIIIRIITIIITTIIIYVNYIYTPFLPSCREWASICKFWLTMWLEPVPCILHSCASTKLARWNLAPTGWMFIFQYITGWWFQPTPLKNMSQLGWWHSQYYGKIKFMFQTTKQMSVWNVWKFSYEASNFTSTLHPWCTRKNCTMTPTQPRNSCVTVQPA